MTMLLSLLAAAYAQDIPSPDARLALALYCNPVCSNDVLDALDDGLRAIRSRDGFGEDVTFPERIMGLAGPEFGIPDAAYAAAYGIDVGDVEKLAASQQVIIAWIAGPREEALGTLAVAHAAFTAAARLGNGWVEDLDTGTVYGVSAWANMDPRGPVTDWFVIEARPMSDVDGAPLRLVTEGLRRFGIPELVVEDVPVDAAGDVGFVINAVADTLYARRGAMVPAQLAVKTAFVDGMTTLVEAPAGEDDPAPPLLRLRFEGTIAIPGDEVAPPPEPMAAPEVVASIDPTPAPLGPTPPEAALPDRRTDAIAESPPTSLAEAQARALARLDREVRAAWTAGLPAGAAVAVSAPFRTRSGSVEYLWVELRQWSGANMSGVLVNEPYNVANLHKGDTVAVRQADVFDYIWKTGDGGREGNTTAPFVTR